MDVAIVSLLELRCILAAESKRNKVFTKKNISRMVWNIKSSIFSELGHNFNFSFV